MTLDAYRRVWENTPDRRGTRKLVLLALAKYADDLGVCWPSIPTLSALMSEEPNYVRKLVQYAEEDGDILGRPGKCRSNPTVYGIAVGLDPAQRRRLAIIVQHTIVKQNVRYIEIGGAQVVYTPGSEEELFKKGVLQYPFSENGGVENPQQEAEIAPPPRSTASRPASRPARGRIRPAAEPEPIRWLREEEGIVTAGTYIGCDLDALIADYKNRRAENQPKGAIVKYWQQYGPPTQETYYRGRHHEENQPGRSVQSQDTARKRRPRPGDSDYDYSRGRS